MTSTQLIASADGEPVALHDFGGDGPDLLFGHGNGLNAGMWAAVVPHLVGRFHCWGIDLRGHGATGPRPATYSVDRNRFADDLMDQLNQVIVRQQAQIDLLLREVAMLRAQTPADETPAFRSLRDELPPHY